MRISFDLRFASLPGGGRVYAQKLLPALVREYPELQWRIYHNPQCRFQQEIIRQIKGEAMELRAVRSRCLSLGQHREFLRFRDNADLYHYLHFDAPLGMRGIATVVTIHDLYPLTVKGYCSAPKRAYFYRVARYNAKRAAKIIAISQHTKNDIVEHLGVAESRVDVIPQSQAPCYHPIEDRGRLEDIRRKYRLPENFIFYTGNHKPHKNLARLLDAYAHLPETIREDFPLILTGSISREARVLRERAAAMKIENHFCFTGWVDEQDLPGLYNLASLVVQPSMYEGFGLAPLEAMACGRPVVCSNSTAVPEVVGTTGRVFDPYQVEDITRALREALEKDIDNPELREKCLRQAAKFSEKKTAELTRQCYRSVAAANG